MPEKQTVVLAFSGGLDTSYCARYLAMEKGYELHTVTVNTGGFTPQEMADIAERAYECGAVTHIALDETGSFYTRCLRYLIFANALRNNTYPLSVSAERSVQAEAVARYAEAIGADYLAHGSTGAGNDQVRFDMAFHIFLPGVPILTPVRDAHISRAQALEFLRRRGCSRDWSKAPYSINKGLWGTTIGGRETLASHGRPPEEAFPTAVTKQSPERWDLTFRRGELCALNGRNFEQPTEAIQVLQDALQAFGIGRDIHIGDSIVGLKGRVAFEAAAPLVIIKAHHALEKHTLSARQLALKERFAQEYAEWLHQGHFAEPAMRNIEVFLASTQESVSGTVSVYCAPYHFYIEGVQSSYDLMRPEFGSYGEQHNAWDGNDVRGYARIAANQTAHYYKVHGSNTQPNAMNGVWHEA